MRNYNENFGILKISIFIFVWGFGVHLQPVPGRLGFGRVVAL